MKVLVACEESQAVCVAFREREVMKPTLVIFKSRPVDTRNGIFSAMLLKPLKVGA